MKRFQVVILVAVVFSFFLVNAVAAVEAGIMRVATGKVTAVDPGGKGIVVSEKIGGKETMDVGTIVDKDTVIKVKGKKAPLNDIAVGDTVTIRYLKSDDLYAKEIVKK
jgi:hypothetical protein